MNKMTTDQGLEIFRGTLDTIPVLAFTVNRELQFTYFNYTAAQLLQAHKMPLIKLGDSINAESVVPCSQLVTEISKCFDNESVNDKTVLITLPLHKLEISFTIKSVLDSQNGSAKISVFGQEVRGADPAIARVSTAANSWQILFSNMEFYVWTYYFESNTVVLTPNCHSDLDLPKDFHHRLPFNKFLEIIHPDDRDDVSTTYYSFFNNSTVPSLTQEYRIRHVSGQFIWVRDKISIQYDTDGKGLYAVGLFEDISEALQAKSTVEANATQLRMALEAIGGAIWTFHIKDKFLQLDLRHQEMLGQEELLSFKKWRSLIHPNDLENVSDLSKAMTVEHPDLRLSYRMKGADGKYFHAISMGQATHFDEKGIPIKAIGVMYDASNQFEAQEKLRLSEERLNLAFETAKEGVWELYPKEGKTFRSQSYLQFMGYAGSSDTQHEPTYESIVHPDDIDYANSCLKKLVEGELNENVISLRMIHKDGHTLHTETRSRVIERDDDGTAIRIVGVVEDISERVEHQKEIEELAYYDPLTGLPNRRLVLERANQALELEIRHSRPVTLMMLDMDKFKEINDTMGHDAGDMVLKELSQRFLTCMRSMDTLGRQGGDEFIVVLPECNRAQAYKVAKRIIEQVKEPIIVKGRTIVCGVSIGIANAPDNGDSIDELLRNADIAMYRAKENQTDIAWFDPEYAKQMESRIQLEQELNIAVKEKGLHLCYQPRISLENGEIVSVEALLRWNHKTLGFVSPDEFIPLAEEVGLIIKIGESVIEQACNQLSEWKKQGIHTTISINASPDELLNTGYADYLLRVMHRYDLAHELIEIELTETAAISNWDKVINTLNKLDEAGIVISLDDWGTGYSSLSYLTQLPAHYVKLDRSFIENLHNTDPKKNTQLILKGMTGLTQSLGFELVAEGIETAEQARSVKELGCRQGQGYLFSRPLPSVEVTKLLKQKYIKLPY